jgi:hypothetical protein
LQNGGLHDFHTSSYTGHTQYNGAVLILFTIKTAPFFCVCTELLGGLRWSCDLRAGVHDTIILKWIVNGVGGYGLVKDQWQAIANAAAAKGGGGSTD